MSFGHGMTNPGQGMEEYYERMQSQWTEVDARPRAPGRGRRDPQAEEEDAFVERLREQNLAWKVIREMFRETFHKDATEARLQMRLLRRRKERLARWDESDVSTYATLTSLVQIQLLIRARDYWEHEKYNLIAQKEQGGNTVHNNVKRSYVILMHAIGLHEYRLLNFLEGEPRKPLAKKAPARRQDSMGFMRL
ncbi:hypothetical protein ATERTT37_000547 [Aspergillus terreus]